MEVSSFPCASRGFCPALSRWLARTALGPSFCGFSHRQGGARLSDTAAGSQAAGEGAAGVGLTEQGFLFSFF